ncbi:MULTISPECIES: hypothetical protein [Streptomyces]|uniref:DUF2637 domain-containing protein n=1 Tax=Streptomyces lycii TaxID=2654337 RepID=A0ABQ7FH90_9ACTN|nr:MULTISPECIES: hypothetical protein [Streptomyces]KAF4407014.1 hypothetical protein GCU69_21990 [Streptomyces lycii]PGH49640.1 hypothetical protein CRI70_16455 [Streptomyces sp. Ru87]
MEEGDVHQRKIIAGVHNATRILTVGSLLVVSVTAARLLTGGKSVTVAQVSLSVDRVWLVFGALTLAHVFVAVFLVRAIEDYRCLLPSGDRAGWVFDEVAAAGNGFVHGLVSRALPRKPGGRYFPMSWNDPSAWVAHSAALLAFVAMLPWWWGRTGLAWHGPWWMIPVALAVVAGNWQAGGYWLIGLSRLDQVRVDEREASLRPVDEDDLLRMRAMHDAMQEPGLTRAEFEWLLGRYRSLIEHRFRIRTHQQEQEAAVRDVRMRPASQAERMAIARHYEAVRGEFPYCDLPPEPWADAGASTSPNTRSQGGSP